MVRRHLGAENATRCFDHLLQHALHGLGDVFRDHLGGFWRFVYMDQAQRNHAAVIGQYRESVGQLDGGHRQAVAVGQRGSLGFSPFAVVRQVAHALTWEIQAGGLPQADFLRQVIDRFTANVEGNFTHAHVTGVDQDACQIQHRTFSAGYVTNGVFAQLQGAWVNLDLVAGFPAPGFQGSAHGDGFHGRTRLEHVDHCAVTHHRRLQVATVVGVIGRLIDHGEDLAGLHVHDHQAAGLGAILDDRVTQFAVGQVLQAQIDRQRQRLAGLGVFGDLDILDQPATPILDDLALAGNAGQPFVVGQFDTFAAVVIDVGETHHVRGGFTGRVETPKFLDAVDAGNFEIEHLLALLRGKPTNQVDEFFIGLGFQAFGQGLAVLPEGSGQFRPLVLGNLQLFGVGPQGGHRGTDGQGLAITVGDQATVCRNWNMPQAAGVTLADQEVAIDHLQVEDAPDDRAHHQCQQAEHQTEAPWVECPFEFHHGATMRTSAAPGMCIFNCSVASTSIRLWAVQVLCSRINRPHSAWALSRTLNSPYRVLSN